MGRLGQSRLSKWIERRRLDRCVAALALLFAVLALPLRTLVTHIYATTLPVVVGTAALLYLVSTRGDSYDTYPLPTFSAAGARLLETGVLLAVSLLFVLGGHVLAIWVAHSLAFELFPGVLAAIRSQYPSVVVMVFYTMTSLWVITQPYAPPPYV